MLKLNNKEYKVCLLDTNIIRSTLEMSQDIHLQTLLKLRENYVFAFSVLTLVEMSHRKELIEKFINFINSIPIIILQSSDQVFRIEKHSHNRPVKIDELILLISNPIIPKTKDEIVQFLRSSDFQNICKIVKDAQTGKYNDLKKEIEKEINYDLTPEEFTVKRLETQIGNNIAVRFQDSSYLSQKIINLLIYYTYFERKKKIPRSDPFDFLIACCVPYVDVFITEKNQTKSLNMINNNHDIINFVSILTMSDLREQKNMAPNSK